MRKVLIHTHSGLGDNICCYGIVKHFAENELDEVYVSCKEIYLDSVMHLYRNDDNIFIVPIPNPGNNISLEFEYVDQICKERDLELIRIGFDKVKQPFHYTQFYNQVSVPYEKSWDNFTSLESTPESKQLYNSLGLNGKEYVLLIRENSYGKSDLVVHTDLPKIEMYKTDLGTGVFDWLDVIKNAKEIHSVGTGPFHVVDRITDFNYNCLFYFHNVRDDYKTIDTKLKWNLIEYEQTPLGYWRSNSR